MFKTNYLYITLLFTVLFFGIGCDEKKNKHDKKYEFDVKLHNVSGKNLDWCTIYKNPPKYDVSFESFGIMRDGIYATKSFMYGIIPHKARLRYLFEYEVDEVAKMRVAGKIDEAEIFAKSKEKYIEFDIDTSKIPQILEKKDKCPFLIIKIISLNKIETEITES